MAEYITHHPMGKISSSGSAFRIALDSVGGRPFHTGVEPSLYATARVCQGGYLVATAYPDKHKVIVEPINDLDLASSNVTLGTSFDPETLALLHFRATFKPFEIAIKEEEKEGVITSVKLIVEGVPPSDASASGAKKSSIHKTFLSYTNHKESKSNAAMGNALRLPGGGGGLTSYAVHVHLFIGTSYGTFFICDGLRGSILSICRFVDWSPVEAAVTTAATTSPAPSSTTNKNIRSPPLGAAPSPATPTRAPTTMAAPAVETVDPVGGSARATAAKGLTARSDRLPPWDEKVGDAEREPSAFSRRVDPQVSPTPTSTTTTVITTAEPTMQPSHSGHALGHPNNVLPSAASWSRSTTTIPLMMDSSGTTMPPDHTDTLGTIPPLSAQPLAQFKEAPDPHDYYYTSTSLPQQQSLTLNPESAQEHVQERNTASHRDDDEDDPRRHRRRHSMPSSPLLHPEASGSSSIGGGGAPGWTGYNSSSSPLQDRHRPMSSAAATGFGGGGGGDGINSPTGGMRSSEQANKLNTSRSSHNASASTTATRRPSSLENTFSLTSNPIPVHREHQEAVVACIPCYSSVEGRSWNARLLYASNNNDSGSAGSSSSPVLQGVYVVHQNGYVVSLDREALDIFMSVAQKLAEEAMSKYARSSSHSPIPMSRPSLLDWNMVEAPSTIPCVGPAAKFVTTITDVYDTDEVVPSSQNQFLNSLTNVFNANSNNNNNNNNNNNTATSRQRFQRMVLDAALCETTSHGGEESARKGRIDRYPALLLCGAQPSFTVNLIAHRDTSFGVRAVKAVTYMTGLATRVMKNMFTKSAAPTMPQATPLEHKKLLLDHHFLDPRIIVTKARVDPTQQWAALYAEDIHRLYLVDMVTGAVLRVLKGRRNIQFQWVMRTLRGHPRVMLLVMQPDRQLIELYDVQHTHRIAAGRIPAEAILLPSPTTVDGSNGQDGNELLCLMPSGVVYRIVLDLEGMTLQRMQQEAAVTTAAVQTMVANHGIDGASPSPISAGLPTPSLTDHSTLLEVLKTCERPEDFFDCAQNIPLPQYCSPVLQAERKNKFSGAAKGGQHGLGETRTQDSEEGGGETELSSSAQVPSTVGLGYFVLYTQWMDQICEWIEWQFSPGKSASRAIPFVGLEPQRIPRTLTAGQTLNYLRKHTAVVRAYHSLVAPPEPLASDDHAMDGGLFADREIAPIGMIPLVDEEGEKVVQPEEGGGGADAAGTRAHHPPNITTEPSPSIPHFTRTPSLVMNLVMRRVLKGLVPSRLINTPMLFPSPGLVAAEVFHKWGMYEYGTVRKGTELSYESENLTPIANREVLWFKKKNLSFWRKCFVRVAHGLPGHGRCTVNGMAKNSAAQQDGKTSGTKENERVSMNTAAAALPAFTKSGVQDADVFLQSLWNHLFESPSTSHSSASPASESTNTVMDLNAFLRYFYCGNDKQLLFLRHRIKREENETPGLDVYAQLGELVFGQYGLSIFSHQLQPLTELGMSMADIANLCVAWVTHACAEVGAHTFFASLSLGAFFSTFIVLSENALLNALESNPIDLVCHSKEQVQKSKARLEALIMICIVRCLLSETQSKPVDMFAFHLKFASPSPSHSQKLAGGRARSSPSTPGAASPPSDPFFLCLRRFLRLWELLEKYEALMIVDPIPSASPPQTTTVTGVVGHESSTTTSPTKSAPKSGTAPTASHTVMLKLRPLRLSLLHQSVPFSGAASSTTLEEYILEATGMDFARVFQMHECIARNSIAMAESLQGGEGGLPPAEQQTRKDKDEEDAPREELLPLARGTTTASPLIIENKEEAQNNPIGVSTKAGVNHQLVCSTASSPFTATKSITSTSRSAMHYLQLAQLLFLCGAPAVFATYQPSTHRSAAAALHQSRVHEKANVSAATTKSSLPWLQVEGQWNREVFDLHVRKPLRALWETLSDDAWARKKKHQNKNAMREDSMQKAGSEVVTNKLQRIGDGAEDQNELDSTGRSGDAVVDLASSAASSSSCQSSSSAAASAAAARQFDQCCFFVTLLGVVEQLIKPLEARLHTFWESSTIPSPDFLSVLPAEAEGRRSDSRGAAATGDRSSAGPTADGGLICLTGTRSMNDFFASLADMLLFILEVHRGIGLEKEGAQLSLTKTLSFFIVQDDHRVFTTVPSGLRDRLCILLSIVGENPCRIRQCTEQLMQLVNMIQFFMQSAQLQVKEMPLNLTDVHLPWKEVYGKMEELHLLRPASRMDTSTGGGGGGGIGGSSSAIANHRSAFLMEQKQRQNVVARILRSFLVEGLILPTMEQKRAEAVRVASHAAAGGTAMSSSPNAVGAKLLTMAEGNGRTVLLPLDYDDEVILERIQSVDAYCVLAQLGSLLGMSENVAALVVLDFHLKHLVDIKYMDQQLVQERTNPACLRLVCTHLQMLLHAVYDYLLHHSEFIPQGTRRTYLVQARRKVEATLSPRAKMWLKMNATSDDTSAESESLTSELLSKTPNESTGGDGVKLASFSSTPGNGTANSSSSPSPSPPRGQVSDAGKSNNNNNSSSSNSNNGFVTASSSMLFTDDGIQWFTAEEKQEYTIEMQRMITARTIDKTERIKRTLLLLTNFAFDADERYGINIRGLRNDIQIVADFIISVL